MATGLIEVTWTWQEKRSLVFYEVVSAALSQCRWLPAETVVFAIHMVLYYTTVIQNKFVVLVVHEQLAIKDWWWWVADQRIYYAATIMKQTVSLVEIKGVHILLRFFLLKRKATGPRS